MAGEWPTVNLGDVADCLTGFPFGSSSYSTSDGDPKLLRGDNVAQGRIRWDGAARWSADNTAALAEYWLREGDVILAMDRPWIEAGLKFAAVRQEDLPCLLVQRVARLRGKAPLRTDFLKYLVGSREFTEHVLAVQTGTTVPHISPSQIKSFEFRLPPPDEQARIAHILGALDDKIDLNRRTSETLEAMARGLFKSWFVDFDPVRAKAEARDTRLPKEIADLFPDSFEDSEMGEIPSGWEPATLAAIADLNSEVWSSDTRPDSIQYVDLSSTKWGRIDEVTTHLREDAPSRAQRVLRPKDTIVGTVRPGNGSYAFVAREGLTGSTGFAVLRARARENSEFVYLAATTAENIESLAHLADGGAYPAVRPDVVAATPVVKASQGVIEAFSRIVSPLLEKSAAFERESLTIGEIRDELLPVLLAGHFGTGADSRCGALGTSNTVC